MAKTNGVLTYPVEDRRKGFRVKVRTLQFGYEMIATESQARTARAFYPHRTAPSMFALQLELVGFKEHRRFNRWMLNYMDYVLSPSRAAGLAPEMSIRVRDRRFFRKGVPVQGINFDYEVGKMVWSPTVVFVASREPLDAKYDEFDVSVVKLREAIRESPHTEYFYPSGTQLSANQVPNASAYDTLNPVDDDKGKGGKDKGGTGGNQDIQDELIPDIFDSLNPFD